MNIRDLTAADERAWLELFLASMNWRGTEEWTLAAARQDPHVRRYLDAWGARDGDAGVVAVDDNVGARGLYEASGFTRVGRVGGSDTLLLRF